MVVEASLEFKSTAGAQGRARAGESTYTYIMSWAGQFCYYCAVRSRVRAGRVDESNFISSSLSRKCSFALISSQEWLHRQHELPDPEGPQVVRDKQRNSRGDQKSSFSLTKTK